MRMKKLKMNGRDSSGKIWQMQCWTCLRMLTKGIWIGCLQHWKQSERRDRMIGKASTYWLMSSTKCWSPNLHQRDQNPIKRDQMSWGNQSIHSSTINTVWSCVREGNEGFRGEVKAVDNHQVASFPVHWTYKSRNIVGKLFKKSFLNVFEGAESKPEVILSPKTLVHKL